MAKIRLQAANDKPFPGTTLRPLAPPDWEERALREADHLREDLPCVPFYANRAKAWRERTGSETGYWLDLYGNGQYSRRPLIASSTAALHTL